MANIVFVLNKSNNNVPLYIIDINFKVDSNFLAFLYDFWS